MVRGGEHPHGPEPTGAPRVETGRDGGGGERGGGGTGRGGAAPRIRRRQNGGGGAEAAGPGGSGAGGTGAVPRLPAAAVGRRAVPADAGDGAAAGEPQQPLHRGLQHPRLHHQRQRGGGALRRAAPSHPAVERRLLPGHLLSEPVAVPAAGAPDRDLGAGYRGQGGAAPSRRGEADAGVRDRRGCAGHAKRLCHLQLPNE